MFNSYPFFSKSKTVFTRLFSPGNKVPWVTSRFFHGMVTAEEKCCILASGSITIRSVSCTGGHCRISGIIHLEKQSIGATWKLWLRNTTLGDLELTSGTTIAVTQNISFNVLVTDGYCDGSIISLWVEGSGFTSDFVTINSPDCP